MNNDCRLYLGNLEYNSSSSDITAHFSTVGSVIKVDIIRNAETQRSKGFAFLEMSKPEEAEKAIQELHLKDFRGRKLVVQRARPREERQKATFARPSFR